MDAQQNISMLGNIERISNGAAKTGLDYSKLSDIKPDIVKIADFLQIAEEQAVLFSCIVDLSLQRTVTLDTLARHLKCSILKIIDNIKDFEVLERQTYILRCNKAHGKKFTYSDFGYIVPYNVVEALRISDRLKLKQTINFNLPNFLEKITDLIRSREENSTSTADLISQIEFLIANNLDHSFIQFIDKNVSGTINKCLIFAMAYLRLRKEYNINVENLTQLIFDDLAVQMEYEQNIASCNNELFRAGIVYFQDSQFNNEKVLTLTSKVTKELYKDYPELNIKNETEESLIKSENIKSKDLYFDENLQSEISRITKVLDKSYLRQYQKRLQAKSLPTGVTIIFYGKSGSGKTETVYQIAKRTKRDILMVDLSKLKNKWFGDTEKIIKKVFDDYRRFANECAVIPILFINEADGMFSKRIEISNNSSVEQTINTTQNIILQEMESFEGILFATTNLTINMDSAFERRFLFKVEFDMPNPEISQKIWKSKIPELTQSQIDILSSKFLLSGGEIDNIVRKYLMSSIIGTDEFDFHELIRFCEKEKPFHNKNKIGFTRNS